MECSDGSPMIPNYHCREDGGKCHLPKGGDCYKLDKKSQAASEAGSECMNLLSACKELVKAHALLNTGELIKSGDELQERQTGLRRAVCKVVEATNDYST